MPNNARNRPGRWRTVIGTIFDALERDERIDDVYVSTNEKFAPDFETYLEESEFEKPELSVEETTAEDEKFGVVGALAQLVDREGLTDDTLVVAGDNLISFEIADFLDAFEANDAPTLASYDVGSYDRAGSYGLVELDDDGRVIDFQEKPDDPKSTLVSIACYGFPGETLPKLEAYLADDNNPDEPGWFVQWLQDREPVYGFTFDEAWFDIGTPESYLDAVAWYLDGGTYVSSIVFPEATIVGGELRRSIVDENTQVEGLNLSGAVIGAHTELNGGET
ncbi:glucose-1-phosphate thymidylyltransferase [Halobacteriales archaeon QS_9_70_65]|nr:MAG: glucose-1-phosphate thymidylyltransferase [Halobacteriales archaeon QS_9_70_65]